ncbi:DUF1287 domain-containing protein [Dysgonomonas sp. HDW5B]|uniref:DUF1287 domain-containing protein n=1 Tax=Dysgonomonas sp. HDW5B TaxID=2714927 RepID=UPI00140895F1|nr:DUF1287 domain-containing protein [Dysgonomonas sp. HDW5B]QIK55400.1 DUF1287 domain-containing protein [Dysgonomonas sp. HDW5B]
MNKLLFIIIYFYSCFVVTAQEKDFYNQLSDAAIDLTRSKVTYDPTYFSIPYPNGDVPANKGVCTDVVIRAYRKMNIDLQKKVHEDMKANFSKYPSQKKWGLKKTDTNIDHRRVYNLETFFTRNGIAKPISTNAEDYQPGDIVSWTLDNGLAHIGIVVDRKSKDGKRHLIVHNIGGGQVIEDRLFAWKIVGHYQYK